MSSGSPRSSATFPAGSARFGPATAPTVVAHTTVDRSARPVLVHRQVGGGVAGLQACGRGRTGEHEAQEQQRGLAVGRADDHEDGPERGDPEAGGEPGPPTPTVGDADQGKCGDRGTDDAACRGQPGCPLRPRQARREQPTDGEGSPHAEATEHLSAAEDRDRASLDVPGRRRVSRTPSGPDGVVGGHRLSARSAAARARRPRRARRPWPARPPRAPGRRCGRRARR